MFSVEGSALPENLIEAELLGHARGAFTGATENRVGRFEHADGGTVFQDGLGHLPMGFTGEAPASPSGAGIQRLGGAAAIKVNVLVILFREGFCLF
jgi:transcriptional regulator with GAF, ATPase, and Fis domain